MHDEELQSAQNYMVGTSLLAGKTQHKYPAPIAAMSAIYEGCIVPIDAGLDIESQYFGTLLVGAVARNMMRTLFVNKCAADKLSRRPQDIPKSQVKKLGILGAGMMGAGIAYVSAKAGIPAADIAAADIDESAGKLSARLRRQVTGLAQGSSINRPKPPRRVMELCEFSGICRRRRRARARPWDLEGGRAAAAAGAGGP